ncbi:hypothetical protein JCM18900_1975 [Psychrobacter sp. JCM 18900]|nr:hypothetical protein JCM18900_1975 [Psychrobacter sp. JCM 18900]
MSLIWLLCFRAWLKQENSVDSTDILTSYLTMSDKIYPFLVQLNDYQMNGRQALVRDDN